MGRDQGIGGARRCAGTHRIASARLCDPNASHGRAFNQQFQDKIAAAFGLIVVRHCLSSSFIRQPGYILERSEYG